MEVGPDEILPDGTPVVNGDVAVPADYFELPSVPDGETEPLDEYTLVQEYLRGACDASLEAGYSEPRIKVEGDGWVSLVKFVVSVRNKVTAREWGLLMDYADELTAEYKIAREGRGKIGGALVEEAAKQQDQTPTSAAPSPTPTPGVAPTPNVHRKKDDPAPNVDYDYGQRAAGEAVIRPWEDEEDDGTK